MATKGKPGRTHQHQEQADLQAQFLMQNVLNDVVRQLERFERVVEGVDRTNSMKRNEEGDRNHVTAEDNLQALKGKLMSFSAMQKSYKGKFTESATNRVCDWITQRPPKSYSGELKQALIDTLDACKGEYAPTVEPIEMTEEMLQDFSQRLAMATTSWHKKEIDFEKDPKAAVSKSEPYRIRPNEKATYDSEEIKEQFEGQATAPPTVNDQQRDPRIQQDSEAKESHSDESYRGEAKNELGEAVVSILEDSKQTESERQIPIKAENPESISEESSLKSGSISAHDPATQPTIPADNSEDEEKQTNAIADEIINPLSSKPKQKSDQEDRQLDDYRGGCLGLCLNWNWNWFKFGR